jgi:mono/diheme cytochrome c family protein
MHDQAKYEPLEQSAFFGDNRSSRQPPEGTIARGQLREDSHFYAGKVAGKPATTFPVELTEELMERGRQRYNIFCVPCHDKTGNAEGMVVLRGFRKPAVFHIERLRNAPAGYFFDVITNGFGSMPGYAEQIPARDRWAIIAYVRALQLSQRATLDDVPEPERSQLISQRGQQ